MMIIGDEQKGWVTGVLKVCGTRCDMCKAES
jgi:hypothetical protein